MHSHFIMAGISKTMLPQALHLAAVQALLDYAALDLRPFYAGASVRFAGSWHRVADPVRPALPHPPPPPFTPHSAAVPPHRAYSKARTAANACEWNRSVRS